MTYSFPCLYSSVALIVDNTDLFKRISENFISRAGVRFIILLWGDKSSLGSEAIEKVPVFDYKEIIALGKKSRAALLDSHENGKFFSRVIDSLKCALLCAFMFKFRGLSSKSIIHSMGISWKNWYIKY